MVSRHIKHMHEYADQSHRAEFVFTLKKAAVSTILGTLPIDVGSQALTLGYHIAASETVCSI